MRALHLIGMRRADGTKLRFEPNDNEPLILPSWLSEGDREILLAFYQDILTEDRLPRIEVDWYRSLTEVDRTFLRNTRERHGASDYLVVVKVGEQGVALEDILRQPEVTAFEHVAIVAAQPLAAESFGRLAELTKYVKDVVEELYSQMAVELSLRPDGISLLEPLVRALLNPILVVEAYNALVDVHAEGVSHDEQGQAVFLRILGRLLDDMPEQRVVGLAALALRSESGLEEALEKVGATDILLALRARMLIRDGKLRRWALLLEEDRFRPMLRDRVRRIIEPRHDEVPGAKKVLEWLGGDLLERKPEPVRRRVLATFGLIDQGELGRARDELNSIQRVLGGPDVSEATRGIFWHAVGSVHAREGRLAEAVEALRRTLDLFAAGGAPPRVLAPAMFDLGSHLTKAGRWEEAEPVFREALRLSEVGGEPPIRRGSVREALAVGLKNNGRWDEAEPMFREALRLKVEGGDTPTSRGYTLHHLATGLRDHGPWEEAEPVFREALRLKEEGGDTPISRSITIDLLARGLRDNGRWDEAEPMFSEALRLAEEGDHTLIRRGVTLHHLAIGLRDNGRWDEAEPMFREALRLAEEGGDTLFSRAVTLHHLAIGLRDNGRWDEAEPLFREALRLKEVGGANAASGESTLRELARGLATHGQWDKAEQLLWRAFSSVTKTSADTDATQQAPGYPGNLGCRVERTLGWGTIVGVSAWADRLLVVSSRGATLIHPETGSVLNEIECHARLSCADGETGTVVMADGRLISVWHLSGQLLDVFAVEGSARSLAVSPGSKWVAIGTGDGTVVLRSPGRGDSRHVIACGNGPVGSLAFSPRGTELVTGSDDKTIRLWRVPDGTLVRDLGHHAGQVDTLAYSPNGALVASAASDRTVRIWRVADSERHVRIDLGFYPTGLCWTDDGDAIVSVGWDGMVGVWRSEDSAVISRGERLRSDCVAVASARHGQIIFCASRGAIVRLALESDESHLICPGRFSESVAVASIASTSHRTVCAKRHTMWRSSVELYDAGSLCWGNEVRQTLRALIFSPDESVVVSGGDNGKIAVFEASTGSAAREFDPLPNYVGCVVVAPDGDTIVSGCWDGSVRTCRISAGVVSRTFDGHSSWVVALALTADGAMVASAEWDGHVILWYLSDDALAHRFASVVQHPNCVSFSPSGELFAVGGMASGAPAVAIVETASRTVRLTVPLPASYARHWSLGPTAGCSAVAFSPDGKWIAAGTEDGILTVLDVEGKPVIQPIRASAAGIKALSFEVDSHAVSGCDAAGVMRRWVLH